MVPRSLIHRPAPGRRLLAAATLLLLFVAGPAHVWHHDSGPAHAIRVNDDGGQCVLCSTFHHGLFTPATAPALSRAAECLGVVQLADAPAPAEVRLLTTPSRAPPCPLA